MKLFDVRADFQKIRCMGRGFFGWMKRYKISRLLLNGFPCWLECLVTPRSILLLASLFRHRIAVFFLSVVLAWRGRIRLTLQSSLADLSMLISSEKIVPGRLHTARIVRGCQAIRWAFTSSHSLSTASSVPEVFARDLFFRPPSAALYSSCCYYPEKRCSLFDSVTTSINTTLRASYY